jgi:hypothetical protein
MVPTLGRQFHEQPLFAAEMKTGRSICDRRPDKQAAE